MIRRRIPVLLVLLLAACGGADDAAEAPPADTLQTVPPVALDADPRIEYPAALRDTGPAGTVRLRLFVDETGHVHPESTRIAESSGVAALDSAAAAGAADLTFAPALREGRPVGALFVQPVEFKRP